MMYLFLMVVLEELDSAKKGVSEVARNVRQVSRFIDEIINNTNTENIKMGWNSHLP
ncbi:MAG: PIN domain-containing protein [Proteobacteria bacterium]|nr:PIN domain-containing protein [Pseudomonadota bacterium]